MRTHRPVTHRRSAAALVAAALVALLTAVVLLSAAVLSTPPLSAAATGAGRTRPATPVVAGRTAAQFGEEVALASLSAAQSGPNAAPTAPNPPGDLTVAVTSLRSLLLPAVTPAAAGNSAVTPPSGEPVTVAPTAGSSPADPATTSTITTTVPAPATDGAAPATGVWAELRQCESGGNYATDTGNGYYGAYQFSEATWLAIGESGYPSQAPPAVQDAAAEQLQARSGWGQWPACSLKLGL